MATRIIELPLEAPPEDISAPDGYDHVLVLARRRGSPVALARIPLDGGRVRASEVRSALARSIEAATVRSELRRDLAGPAADDGGPLPTATVAICTRERPDDLERCLAALAELAHKPDQILVVDNNPSTDRTRLVAERHPGLQYVMEPRRGLDNARNRAMREAKGQVVAFIDDDAVADRLWLGALLRPFRDPQVQCVTGLTMPLELETPAQEMFETFTGFSLRGFVRRTFQSPPDDPLATGSIGAGANMAVRASVIAEIGEFDPALDAGTPTQSGGDHEFFSRVLRRGHRIVYEPDALNWHRHRRSWEELRQVIHGYGVGVYASWTRSLLVERDRRVFGRAFGWFLHVQGPGLLKSMLKPSPDRPRELLWAELKGCCAGPFAYLSSRRSQRGIAGGRIAGGKIAGD